jgi:hypothetical protein
MKTAKEWAKETEMDTHMPEETELFERWARAIQADALGAAAGECGALAEAQRRYLRRCQPAETVVISATKLAVEAFEEAARVVRKLKELL